VMAYITEGGPFFDFSLNATMLGVVVVLCGAVAWIIILLTSDPKHVMKFARAQK